MRDTVSGANQKQESWMAMANEAEGLEVEKGTAISKSAVRERI